VDIFSDTPLWPVLHHSVTQPRPLIKCKYRNVCCLQSLHDVELQQIFFWSNGVEQKSFQEGCIDTGSALPSPLPAYWVDQIIFYSQIFINNWQDWQNCILSPWNVVKMLTGQPPACSLDCNGHLTFNNKMQQRRRSKHTNILHSGRKNINNILEFVRCLTNFFIFVIALFLF